MLVTRGFYAGGVRWACGETLLLCRVEDCSGLSHFCVARSADGVTDWKIDPQPTLEPDVANYPEERWGIEDPRIVWMPELAKYSVAYTCYSQRVPAVFLALTEDFTTFDRLVTCTQPEYTHAAPLPRRLNDRRKHRLAPRA